jgi:hypothetical protein
MSADRRRWAWKTNPISRLRIGDWKKSGGDAQPTKRRSARNEPNFLPGDREKKCKTKPIPAQERKWQVPGGEEVMVNWSPGQPRQNKANFRARGPRLRIGDCGLRIESCRPGTTGNGVRAEQSQFRAAGCVPRGIMQNEANFARAPGNGRGLVGRDAPPECDCAKRTQFPAGSGGTRPQGRGTRGNRAKQSQFRRPTDIRGANRPKRTQFSPDERPGTMAA